MKQKLFNAPSVLHFTQFTRKSYALFACLGKVVTVGVLSVPTLTYAKADGISVDTAVAADSILREEVRLDEVVVTGSRAPLTDSQTAKMVSVVTREDISHATGAASINDVMKTITGVDVRQRGGFGVQTDISMRGGNFDHITFLLNGVNISSPHTGHLSADFPLSPDDIERIEVLEGPASRIYGASAFNGVINIITREKGNLVNAHLSGGSYGYFNGNAGVCAGTNHFTSHLCGGYSRSDGATPNSAFSSSRFFWHGTADLKNANISAQFGYSYKPYEANTFYGASSVDQWESNERLMGAVNADVRLGRVHLVPGMYWNRWYDHYQWHRNNPSGENYHRADASGGALSAWTETKIGKTSVGIDFRRETIWSTNLGELQDEKHWRPTGGHDANNEVRYKCHDARTVGSAFIEHNLLLRQWTISAGATAIHTPLGGTGIYPGIDIAYRVNSSWKIFASWNMAMRIPTFTDLYYSGANIEGNGDLLPEKTSDFQIGARRTGRGYTAEAELYYSRKSDMIDWVTCAEADDDIFHSVNFRMNNWGGEINLAFLPQDFFGGNFPVKKISASYAYINEDSRYGVTVIQSKYAMEYLLNKIVVAANGTVWRKLNFAVAWRWQDRTGKDNSDYALLDGKLSWDENCWSVYADAANILGKKYYDYVSIRQPGFTIVAGVKVRL